MSWSKIAIGIASVAQALGTSTMPLPPRGGRVGGTIGSKSRQHAHDAGGGRNRILAVGKSEHVPDMRAWNGGRPAVCGEERRGSHIAGGREESATEVSEASVEEVLLKNATSSAIIMRLRVRPQVRPTVRPTVRPPVRPREVEWPAPQPAFARAGGQEDIHLLPSVACADSGRPDFKGNTRNEKDYRNGSERRV